MKKVDLARLSSISKELKILYVEDDNFIMESMKTLLRDIFSSVETASNGVEALEAIEKSKFDILLTDAIMPKMDGMELIGELQSQGYEIKIGVISAMDEEMVEKLKKMGITELIPKPIDPPMLFDSLFRLCEAASQKN
ncbi:MAG: response regulator [Campylobacterales bacterium]